MADTGLPFASLPGLGDAEIEGFPVDRCPEEMPDLSKHFSITADVLKEEPGLYDAMRSRHTPMGVTFAKCIKTGMDNRGHPMIKTLGAVAGDADCYDTFQPFFDKLIASCYGQASLERPHFQSPKRFIPDVALADPTYVVSSHLRVSRNVQGLRFVPSMLRPERVEVERMLVKALMSNGLVDGDYFPLLGSQTYPLKPGGMQPSEEQLLTQCGRLFREPDSPAVLCTGGGRHWPDGRGVFINQDRTWTAWINEEEHLKLMADRQDGQLSQMLADMAPLLLTLERLAGGFAKSDRLGYLNSSPGNLGTAMTASMVVKLPMLKTMKKELGAWCKSKDLIARGALDEQGLRVDGLVEISHRQKLGVREEDLVKELIQRVSELIRAEKCMERGMSVEAAFDAVVPRELTPIGAEEEEYPNVDAWAHAGDQLGEMLKGYVAKTDLEKVKVRLGQALLASSLSGVLQLAKSRLKDPCRKPESKAKPDLGSKDVEAAPSSSSRQSADGNKPAEAVEIPFELLPSVGNMMLPLPDEGAAAVCRAIEAETTQFKYLPSVGNLLLPLPFPLRNLEEEQKAKEKAEAAARIQAIQRGRAQRAEAKAKAKAKAQAKAKAVTHEEMEQRKALLREALEGALEDGTLERVLSEATYGGDGDSVKDKEAALESLRQKLAGDLMVAAEDGRLEQILAQPVADQMELTRKKMAESMLAAAEDGRLEQALLAEQQQQDMERVRKATAATILAAAEDGRLEGALAAEQKKAHLEHVRQKAGASLLAAAESGRLEQALTSTSEQRKQRLDQVRAKAGASLLAAAESGRLEEVLASTSRMGSTSEEKKRHLDQVRAKAGASLLAAAESGKLEEVLASTSEQQKKKHLEEVRLKTGASLLAAAENGRLEQVLGARKTEADVERVRKKAGASLLAAAENGRLDEVLAEKAQQMELERVRKKIADGLLLAADDGTLEEALSRTIQKENDKKMEDIRSRMAASLLEAVENGSLEQAFQEPLQEKEPLQDTASTALTGLPSDLQRTNLVALANQTAKSHLAGIRQDAPKGAAAVQRALLQYERRIGSLAAAVQQAERGVLERLAEKNSLEVALAEAQGKLRLVKQDAASQRKLLEAEELRALELQESQRQLMDELDFACLKQRHKQLDLDFSLHVNTVPEVTNQ